MKRTQLAHKLSLQSTQDKRKLSSFLIGFDGFTDEIITAVDTRESPTSYVPFETIAKFAARIEEAIGKSCNLEFVTKKTKIGGNGPILAEALVQLGQIPSLIGCLGEHSIEPLFEPLVKRCKQVISLASSGHTDAIEFKDGKILLGKHESVHNISVDLLKKKISKEQWIQLIQESEAFVSVNWTMIPAMTEIWRWLAKEILPHVSKRERLLFVDIADPAKRTDDDLKEALAVLQELKMHFQVHLGLNVKEAERIYVLTTQQPLEDATPLRLARIIQQKTSFDAVIVHANDSAGCSTATDNFWVTGPLCEKPYLLTGGGDNFNAGYLYGTSLGLNGEEAILLGTAASGFYVRTGKSPTQQEVAQFLRTWYHDPLSLDNLIPQN